MRGLLVGLFLLSSCSPVPVPTDAGADPVDSGSPDVDGGEDGGEEPDAGGCVPYTCAGLGNRNCGNISDGCGGLAGGPQGCGTCTAPETCGGGGDYNVCGSPGSDGGGGGSGSDVSVTMRFRHPLPGISACPGVTPSSGYEPAICSQVETLALSRFQTLRNSYASCAISQTGTDTWTIDCTNNCASHPMQCINNTTQMSEMRILWSCSSPAYTSTSTACSWSP